MYSIMYSKMYSITLRKFPFSDITYLVKIRSFQSICFPIHKCTSITNYKLQKKITIKTQKKKITKFQTFFYKMSNLGAFGRKEGFLALSYLNCQLSLCCRETCLVTVNNYNKIWGWFCLNKVQATFDGVPNKIK
jgi:hypothetical protein